MRVLVTGGAGFIGSHTCDQLVEQGHDVVVLDALAAPVHRDGVPRYLTSGVEFVVGDVRDRDLVTGLLRRTDAVLHFAAHQDYLLDFSAFIDVNVTATALLYEIIVAEKLDLARVVIASSQAAMGEGLHHCADHGEQEPGMRSEAALGLGRWDLTCPLCDSPLQMLPTPERIANPHGAYGMSKYAGESVALQLGRRYGIPTVALRYSTVQGARQSFYNTYSGACRIFCMHYALGAAPTLFEDGAGMRDYVNIHDVVDANLLVLSDDRAVGQVFNVGGGTAYTTAHFADVVRRHYGSELHGLISGEYRLGDTRHIVSDIDAIKQLGWSPQRTPADSVTEYASWLDGTPELNRVLAEADTHMRALGVVRRVHETGARP